MYGTIARLQVKPGMFETLQAFGRETSASLSSTGFLWEHVYQSDTNENEIWLVVAFTDREAYHKNANDPAQHAQYTKLRSMLTADPEWHDGTIVDSYPQ